MNSFCIVFDLDKILALTNVNKFPFASLNRIFAVTFDKLRCISTIKMNEFILYCLRFAVTLYPKFRIYILREAALMSSINFLFAKDTTL